MLSSVNGLVKTNRRIYSTLVSISASENYKTERLTSDKSHIFRNHKALHTFPKLQYCYRSQENDFFYSESEMELKQIVKKLNAFANTSLAENWDNVGLLVEPSAPHTVKKVLLTNDLTASVLGEAVDKGADMIISYHPPIFSPLKRLTQRSWMEKLIVQCIESRIAVYSPHTCYDALQGGVNDWLISAFDMKSTKPVEQSDHVSGQYSHQVDILVPSEVSTSLIETLGDKSVVQRINTSTLKAEDGADLTRVTVACNRCDLTRLVGIAQTVPEVLSVQSRQIDKVPLVGYGMGRVGRLTSAIGIDDAVAKVKVHLGLQHVRLAAPPGAGKVSSVAVCAGSGSSVLRNAKADLFVTGEMSHHDVLNAVSNGTCVILCEHSNTERGFLRVLKDKLTTLLTDQVEVTLSEKDCDPLKVV